MCTLLWSALEMPQDCQRAAAAAALSGLVQHWYSLLINMLKFLFDRAFHLLLESTLRLSAGLRKSVPYLGLRVILFLCPIP